MDMYPAMNLVDSVVFFETNAMEGCVTVDGDSPSLPRWIYSSIPGN